MAIYKLRVLRMNDAKLVIGYSVSSTPYEIGCVYPDRLNEFGGGRFKVLEVFDVVPQRKEVISGLDRKHRLRKGAVAEPDDRNRNTFL